MAVHSRLIKQTMRKLVGDLPVQKFSKSLFNTLRHYAVLLMDYHTITCNLMSFAFSLLDPADISELVEELKVDVDDDIEDLDVLAHRIYKKFGAGKSKTLETKLRKILKNKIEQKRGLRPLLACYVPSSNLHAEGDLVELLDLELQNVRYSRSGQCLRFREGLIVVRYRFQRACFEVKIID